MRMRIMSTKSVLHPRPCTCKGAADNERITDSRHERDPDEILAKKCQPTRARRPPPAGQVAAARRACNPGREDAPDG